MIELSSRTTFSRTIEYAPIEISTPSFAFGETIAVG
jgi:hypothetical protein